MFKRLLSMLVFAMLFVAATINPASANTTVAVVLDTPAGMFSEPEKVNATFKETLDKIFTNSPNYTFLPMEDANAYIQIYREEHDLITSMNNESGFATLKPLKKEDYDNICKYFGADYLIYANVTSSIPTFSGGFFSASQSVNVVTDFRVWSNSKADFAYMKRVSAKGKSTTIYAGGIGSSTHAIEKGLKKDLQELEKESSKIRSAMTE
ncbi:MAG: hypothetical protein IJ668_06725 [Selenomonadaceae bacterium]|nr:hypothetical protein [Selenomonadaceae bacterium]